MRKHKPKSLTSSPKEYKPFFGPSNFFNQGVVQKKQTPFFKGAKLLPSKQGKENKTGLPDNLKSRVENLSGYAMDDVKVHYNSDKPAQLQAHAYTQGKDIHIASGQEKHLPHEAWHVVQQKQGRVKPTIQMKGKVNINDDAGLEKEADVMGAKAFLSMNNRHDINKQRKTKESQDNSILKTTQFKVQNTIIGGMQSDQTNLKTQNLDIGKFDNSPVQCQFAKRSGAYMVVVRDSALRHLNEATMRLVIANALFLTALNTGYAGDQVNDLTIRVERVKLVVNIFPAGHNPPVVEVFHSDAGYQKENRQKARDRWNSLYGDKGGKGKGMDKI